MLEIIIFIIAFFLFGRSIFFIVTSEKAGGTVVKLIEDAEDTLYAPIIEFTAGRNQTVRFTETIYQNPPYEIGANVTVLYSPRNPKKACIRRFDSLFLIPSVVLFLGILTFVLKPFVLPILKRTFFGD